MENKIHSEKGGKLMGEHGKPMESKEKNMKENLWKMKDNLSRTKKQTNLQPVKVFGLKGSRFKPFGLD